MSKHCYYCGADNEDHRLFCSSCGKGLDQGLKMNLEFHEAINDLNTRISQTKGVREDGAYTQEKSRERRNWIERHFRKK